jgi:hypothetical protein
MNSLLPDKGHHPEGSNTTEGVQEHVTGSHQLVDQVGSGLLWLLPPKPARLVAHRGGVVVPFNGT